MSAKKRELILTILIEKDEDGYYVASVAELPGCHTQARTMKELMKRIQEAITLYLEAGGEPRQLSIRRIRVRIPSAKGPSQ